MIISRRRGAAPRSRRSFAIIEAVAAAHRRMLSRLRGAVGADAVPLSAPSCDAGGPVFEPLEPRLLLSADLVGMAVSEPSASDPSSGIVMDDRDEQAGALATASASASAPSSIDGYVLDMVVTAGSGGLAEQGRYLIRAAPDGGEYEIVGLVDVAGSEGTYSETPGDDTVEFAFTDALMGEGSATFTFDSPAAGTFELSAAGGEQSGFFSAYEPVDDPDEQVAPASLAGLDIEATVLDGVPPFADAGSFVFQPAESGNGYVIEGSGGVLDSAGTYSYEQVSAREGLIELQDSAVGTALTQVVHFSSSTSGVYLLTDSSGETFQSGEFEVLDGEPAQGQPQPPVLGPDGLRLLHYTDPSGTDVTVRFTGGQGEVVLDGTDLSFEQGHRGITVVGEATLEQITLSQTGFRDALTIRGHGGDGTIEVGSITGDAPLGRLIGPDVALVGDGLVLEGDGVIQQVRLGDVHDHAAIAMPGEANRPLNLQLGSVGDEVELTSASPIQRLAANQWEGGAIEAPSINRLHISGDRQADVDGDFTADLTLTDDQGWRTLGQARIAGDIDGSTWSLAGRAGAIVADDVSDWTLNAQDVQRLRLGEVTNSTVDAGTIGVVQAVAWNGGEVEAESIRALQMRGDRRADVDGDFTADLTLTDDAGWRTLGQARIAGDIDGSTWSLAGRAGAIVADDVSDWTLNAQDVQRLRLGEVTNSTIDAGTIGMVQAVAWNGGEVEAESIRALQMRGDRRADVDGDFTADLTLTDGEGWRTLGQARIAGDIDGSTWSLAGRAGMIVADGVENWTLNAQDVQRLRLGEVTNSTVDAGAIGVVQAVAWNGGEIEAESIRALQMRGDRRADIDGDFAADLTLTDGEGWRTLGQARIAGDIDGSTWSLAGRAGAIVADDVSDWTLNAQDVQRLRLGEVTDSNVDAGTIGMVQAVAWNGGEIEAGSIRTLQVRGDRQADLDGDFTADLTLTDDEGWRTLGQARIAGAIEGGTWRLAGSLGNLVAGAMRSGTLLVGVDEVPDDATAFRPDTVVQSINLRGIRGDTGPSFADSHIAATEIRNANLGDVATEADEPFGITTTDLRRFSYVPPDAERPERLTANDLSAAEPYEDEDFVIRLL